MPDQAPIKNRPEPIDNTELVEQFKNLGGHIIHCRPLGFRRGITFAYVRKGSRVTFSSAVQHRGDTFTKKIGTKIAIENFFANSKVTLPMGNDRNTKTFFHDLYYAQ